MMHVASVASIYKQLISDAHELEVLLGLLDRSTMARSARITVILSETHVCLVMKYVPGEAGNLEILLIGRMDGPVLLQK
jgi:hypothetical protein